MFLQVKIPTLLDPRAALGLPLIEGESKMSFEPFPPDRIPVEALHQHSLDDEVHARNWLLPKGDPQAGR